MTLPPRHMPQRHTQPRGVSPVMTTTTVPMVNAVPPQVDVHDGQVLYWQGTYYLLGTTYSAPGCRFSLGSPTSQWCGFVADTSRDLENWTFAGLLFDPRPWQDRCGAPNYGCFRPHELYNEQDHRWLLWANISDDNTHPTSNDMWVWASASPAGPFVDVGQPTLTTWYTKPAFGDFNLFKDGDGTAYIAYTVVNEADGGHDLAVEKLSSTYTSGSGQAVHLPRKDGFDMVESPAMFAQGGLYHLLYSDPICAYCSSTGTGWATASSPLGPWTKRGDLSKTSCNGQPSSVTVLPSGEVLYQSDLWLGTPNESAARQHWEVLTWDGARLLPLTCTPRFTVTMMAT